MMRRIVAACSCAMPLQSQSTQFAPSPLPASVTTGVSHIDVGDFDVDGDIDILVFDWFSGLGILCNNGLAEFSVMTLPFGPVGFAPSAVPIFVDMDGDMDLDVFVSEHSSASLFRNDGGGVWTDLSSTLPALVPVLRAHVADFDGDGDQDIACVGLSISGGRNQMLVNQGGGFISVDPFPGSFGTSIDAADIDGDGDLDLMIPEGPPRLWRNDGAMIFTDITTTNLPLLTAVTGANSFADVDGDGDADLFVSGAPNDLDRILLNNGAGVFTELPGAIPQGLGSTQSSMFRDVDEDGDLDLLRGTFFNPLAIATNDGSGMFTDNPNAYPPGTPGIRYIRAYDFDGDLDVDLFAHQFGNLPRVFVNQHRHLHQSSAPQIGQQWMLSVISQPGYAVAPRFVQVGIALTHLLQPLPLPPIGTLWLDPSAPLLLVGSVLPAGSSVLPTGIMVPLLPAIVGLSVYAQALVQEASGTLGVRLTPMLSTTIQ